MLFLKALLGAIVIGVATYFVMKPDPEMHWSIPPNAIVITIDDAVEPGQLYRRGGLCFDGEPWLISLYV